MSPSISRPNNKVFGIRSEDKERRGADPVTMVVDVDVVQAVTPDNAKAVDVADTAVVVVVVVIVCVDTVGDLRAVMSEDVDTLATAASVLLFCSDAWSRSVSSIRLDNGEGLI